MNLKENKIKNKIISIITSISSYLIPIIQYVPCTAVWFGIMSVPILSYIILFFQNPRILIYDIKFLFSTPGAYIALLGFLLFISSLIFQIIYRKQLIRKGPYKFIRHPQYLALIIMTFGLTLVAFQTTPIFEFNTYSLDPYSILLLIWIAEVLTYITLAKIEDFALSKRYGEKFKNYKSSVGFMFPSLFPKKDK